MAQFCLFPDQVEVLNKQQPRVFVTGPPGTGKSIMLYLQGMQWLHEGKDVHVVSIQDNSRAASILMEHLLTQNLRPAVPDTGDDALRAVYADVPKVYRHAFNFDSHKGDVDSAVDRLAQVARDGRIYILADELERLTSKKSFLFSLLLVFSCYFSSTHTSCLVPIHFLILKCFLQLFVLSDFLVLYFLVHVLHLPYSCSFKFLFIFLFSFLIFYFTFRFSYFLMFSFSSYCFSFSSSPSFLLSLSFLVPNFLIFFLFFVSLFLFSSSVCLHYLFQ